MQNSIHNLEFYKPLSDLQKVINRMTSSLDVVSNISKSLIVVKSLSGAYSTVALSQSLLQDICSYSTTIGLITKNATAMQSVLANIRLPTVVDIIPTIERILPAIDISRRIPSVDWDWLNKTIGKYDYEGAEVEDVLTDEIREELNASAEETLIAEDSQKRIEQRYGEWKEKHPLLADIYLLIIGAILGWVVGTIMTSCSARITKSSNVYELPSSTSNIVWNINGDQEITVVNEVPYYYEVVYIDPETGEEKRGYVYKPHISMLTEDVNNSGN